MSTFPKMKPCPICGHDEHLDVYTYDSGATYVECSMECGYLGPACSTARWAIRHHNKERDERARRHLAFLTEALATTRLALAQKDSRG